MKASIESKFVSAEGTRLLLTGGRVVLHPNSAPETRDILISQEGRILAVERDVVGFADGRVIDISGAMVVPGFVDAHQHLDKTGVVMPNPKRTLQGAREVFAAYARRATRDDITARAVRTIRRCRAFGTAAIRSHINVDKDAGFAGLEVLNDVRNAFSKGMTLQFVAFMTPHPNQDLDWVEKNIDSAASMADAIGGTPAVAEDLHRYLDLIFQAAVRHSLPVDLHLDEHLDADRLHFDAVIDRTEKFGMQGRVVIGHASALSAIPRDEFNRIRDRILKNDIGVITLPAANLYLQGRDRDVLPPRGLTRVADFVRSGARIATASDNIQDPFIPTGSGDLLETARWTLLASQLGADDMNVVYSMITDVPAKLLGLGPDHGLKKNARADLVIANCSDVVELVARGPTKRLVLTNGRLVRVTESCGPNLPLGR